MVIQGSNAMFTVTADGTDPLSFQWFFNQTNAITDATNACLTLCGVTQDQSGDYSVTVTDDFGSVTSDALISPFTPGAHQLCPVSRFQPRWEPNSELLAFPAGITPWKPQQI